MKAKLRQKRLARIFTTAFVVILLATILVAAGPLGLEVSAPVQANANTAPVQQTEVSPLTDSGELVAHVSPIAQQVYRKTAPTRVAAPTQAGKGATITPAVTPASVSDSAAKVNTVVRIYQKGQSLGNNPNAFSKVGDCNSLNPFFLSYFDLGAYAYDLGSYSYLQPVIDQFKGSYQRESVAVGDGYNTSGVLSAMWADPKLCRAGETPLACEYRINKPSFSIISLGTDDFLTAAKFEANLRLILDQTINLGIVPILLTKMENANLMNYNPIIIKLAKEYNIPLADLFSAMQTLPGKGLSDNIHPTGPTAGFIFTDVNLRYFGWPVRNLTVLQTLNSAWKQATIR